MSTDPTVINWDKIIEEFNRYERTIGNSKIKK